MIYLICLRTLHKAYDYFLLVIFSNFEFKVTILLSLGYNCCVAKFVVKIIQNKNNSKKNYKKNLHNFWGFRVAYDFFFNFVGMGKDDWHIIYFQILILNLGISDCFSKYIVTYDCGSNVQVIVFNISCIFRMGQAVRHLFEKKLKLKIRSIKNGWKLFYLFISMIFEGSGWRMIWFHR